MRLLLATAAALSLVALGPAVAAGPAHGPCNAPSGAFVVKPDAPLTQTPTTPVGALFSAEESVGDFYVDLSGKSVATTSSLEFTLSWLNPVSDYDLVVNGNNEEGVDNPEVISVKATHCKKVQVAITVFMGVPVDELTLDTKATPR